ncbi:hypothetical protein TNCV_3081071 [Trichonephila clavipes]|nr:hypothetical protein TNCV_3081071 [Trichonephila clavipes]
MSEGRFDLSTFRSERTNEASTLTITPKRSSSRDVEDPEPPADPQIEALVRQLELENEDATLSFKQDHVAQPVLLKEMSL